MLSVFGSHSSAMAEHSWDMTNGEWRPFLVEGMKVLDLVSEFNSHDDLRQANGSRQDQLQGRATGMVRRGCLGGLQGWPDNGSGFR